MTCGLFVRRFFNQNFIKKVLHIMIKIGTIVSTANWKETNLLWKN